MKISIIHPSRSRPEIAHGVIRNWISKCCGRHELEWILSIDVDDPRQKEYHRVLLDFAISSIVEIHTSVNRSAIDAINNAATLATGDILIVVSDDFDCPENWDELIVKAAAGRTDWIMKTQDGTQGWIITLPIMDRVYYNRFGYIYYPEFLHMFSDTHMTCVADLLGRKITADIHFQHNNGIKDKVAERANATWAQGEKLFLKLSEQNFLLKPEEIKGRIKDPGYLSWMKSKGRAA